MKPLAVRFSGHKSILRSTAAVVKNSLRAEPDHYDRHLPREKALGLFQRHVALIEVETTSYCNRTCSFCPNSFIDRRSEKQLMPEACWQTILADIRAVDFTGSFHWSRYSEPTSEERIVERIAQVRRAAPKCSIGIDSNGDYLDAEYIERLVAAGLNRLWVDVYLPNDDSYDLVTARQHLNRFLKRIGKTTAITVGTEPALHSHVEWPGLEMAVSVRNLVTLKRSDLSDRGGLIQIARRTSRTAPCFSPFKNVTIDWDGSVALCCQIRSDANTHHDAIIGKIGENGMGLIEAYVGLAGWRDSLKSFGPKTGPCGSCNVFEYAPTKSAVIASRLLAEERIPGTRLVKLAAARLIKRGRR